MEKRITQLEDNILDLKKDYTDLMDRYFQLQEVYLNRQQQLDRQKQITTTAFTGIWVVAIVTFLIGWYSHYIYTGSDS